jgi:2-polyprenyl-3-methyl-5-hydroxy-6-metoxy-1,4-benzoquinol methylase
MKISYSKPSVDILFEEKIRSQQEVQRYHQQIASSKKLLNCEGRKKCVLCANVPLTGEKFVHRGIPYMICQRCGHVQTQALPDNKISLDFSVVYPNLNSKEYQDRRDRIYKPKLEWVLNVLQDNEFSSNSLKEMKWVEIGTGAGYFLSALQEEGFNNIVGFDADSVLVETANSIIPGNIVHHFKGDLSDFSAQFSADIYVAFFVLEHSDDINRFLLKLNNLPSGTVFIFSVPIFGFSCLLENIFDQNYARNLDNVIHTQLYTDDSIKFLMDEANFKIVAQWVFGQDASDFARFILSQLADKYSEKILSKIVLDLTQMQDPMQECLDRLMLSDQRHIIAIKR